ncbi:MAG: hypothetical protein WD226_01575 [Planctomycetota bacterium]
MSLQPDDSSFNDSNLESPEYRRRLRRKLNTLIAVLEVACAKVRRSLSGPEADTDRLHRIQKNLRDTLQVCVRAKQALERCEALPADLPASLRQLQPITAQRDVEMSSPEEAAKFRGLQPIAKAEVRSVDLDELCRRLLGD